MFARLVNGKRLGSLQTSLPIPRLEYSNCISAGAGLMSPAFRNRCNSPKMGSACDCYAGHAQSNRHPFARSDARDSRFISRRYEGSPSALYRLSDWDYEDSPRETHFVHFGADGRVQSTGTFPGWIENP